MIGTLLAATAVTRVIGADRSPESTGVPANPHLTFMQRAFEMRRLAIARGDQPYGAIVVKDGRIVGEGISAVVTNNDPTAHAEMEAIRDAILKVGEAAIRGAVLYGTSRACSMCETGAHRARIARMVYGESAIEAGPPKLR